MQVQIIMVAEAQRHAPPSQRSTQSICAYHGSLFMPDVLLSGAFLNFLASFSCSWLKW